MLGNTDKWECKQHREKMKIRNIAKRKNKGDRENKINENENLEIGMLGIQGVKKNQGNQLMQRKWGHFVLYGKYGYQEINGKYK